MILAALHAEKFVLPVLLEGHAHAGRGDAFRGRVQVGHPVQAGKVLLREEPLLHE